MEYNHWYILDPKTGKVLGRSLGTWRWWSMRHRYMGTSFTKTEARAKVKEYYDQGVQVDAACFLD